MGVNLVIVESPAKAKTIERILGKDFFVKSSFGHIRDLSKKNFGIDIKNRFEPEYIIPEDKKKIVADLKKSKEKAEFVWLASDEDREGEAIAWHLYEVLGLQENNTRRIVFHEITKEAIQKAVQQPRQINRNLVQAQQARRVLDRLVGFELSPVLWKKVKPALSAGRVQSVAVRLVVEKEREIQDFKSSSQFRISGTFYYMQGQNEVVFQGEYSKKLKKPDEILALFNILKNAHFKISDLVKKPIKRSPAPPFTTSTLQQEASRKLGFSVAHSMSVAQKLYESGKITYMRTDSVNLSSLATNASKKVITQEYGAHYHQFRTYKTKAKGAQEAHEAIRPTYMDQKSIEGTSAEKRLYELIWKRTIASQMSQAEIEKTTATISISNDPGVFTASGEIITFDGFLKVYSESKDEESENGSKSLLPQLAVGQDLKYQALTAREKYTQIPYRFSEASLVRKMEELGIGRPSTYAPTISTIQQRGYVLKENVPGIQKKVHLIEMKDGTVIQEQLTDTLGNEKGKLIPTDIGMVVNDYLMEHFSEIVDFNFTASVEKEFDEIADGKRHWVDMIDGFYHPFHEKIEKSLEVKGKTTGERLLGTDPNSGEDVLAKVGRYGPVVQIGRTREDFKPKFASLLKNQRIDTITLEEALDLFKLPREIGLFEDKEMVAGIGRYGPYLRHDGKFYSIKGGTDPMLIDTEEAQRIILDQRQANEKKVIKTLGDHDEIKILDGKWGPYIAYKKKNYKIPRKMDPSKLTLEDCLKLMTEGDKKKSDKK